MSGDTADRPTVLLADDEQELLRLYETWLADTCDVYAAGGGDEALALIDDAVDVVLLDRRMPDRTGDEVLREIRDRGHDCRVAMLTAVQPQADIIDLPFDDYLTKPVQQSDLTSLVDVLLRRSEFDERSQEFFALVSKRAALETSPDIDHERSEEYQQLTEQIEAVRSDLDQTLVELSEHDYSAAFIELAD
ncbi:MAG: HalX domain-containing protein [Halobacteriaceae archaeon]